jgi:Predicted permease
MEATKKPYTFDRVVRILIGIAVLVAAFLLIRRLSTVLLPFVIGWLLAYILNPIVEFFQYKLRFKNRVLSITCTLLLFFALLGGLIWILVPVMSSEISRLSQLISTYTSQISLGNIIPLEWQESIKSFIAQFDLKAFFESDRLEEIIKSIIPTFGNILNNSFNVLLGFVGAFFVLLYLVFILLDYEKISQYMFNLVPPRYRSITGEVINDVKTMMNRYFRGQALVALCVAVMMVTGFLIIGLPLAIVMGIFVGVLNLVPYMQAFSIPPVIILALLKAAETGQSAFSVLLPVLIVYLVVQVIQDGFLVPKIMGKVTGLNPAIILLSLSIWGALMGLIGMIIALPFTVLIISYYNRFVIKTESPQNLPQEEASPSCD